jgi:hypothetical protein
VRVNDIYDMGNDTHRRNPNIGISTLASREDNNYKVSKGSNSTSMVLSQLHNCTIKIDTSRHVCLAETIGDETPT